MRGAMEAKGGRRARGRRRLGVNVSVMGDDDEVAAAGGGGPGARMGGWKAKGGVQSTPSRFFNGGKRRARAPLTAIGSNGEPGAADDADGAAARRERSAI